jgi:AbrB family looped-hinge helix DNA binding protein
MAKVTSKLQVTVPKALAERYGIDPGDEIEWEAAGDVIRVLPPRKEPARNAAARLRLFDQATARQKAREKGSSLRRPRRRGWTREELYGRGRAR